MGMRAWSKLRSLRGPCFVLLAAILPSPSACLAADEQSQPSCAVPAAQVLHAFRLEAGVNLDTPERRDAVLKTTKEPIVGLGDTVVIEVKDLKSLSDYAECRHKALVLALNDRPLTDLAASPVLDPSGNLLRFDLKLNEKNRADWVYHIGEPRLGGREVKVSVAPSGDPAVASDATLMLVPVRTGILAGWFVGFVLLLGCFVYFARNSNILRADASELAPNLIGKPQYSLSRVQAAWWFFVVMGAFILIGIVTGDFEGAMNGTALSLLGIGAGTAVASATIDASQPDASADDAAEHGAQLDTAQRDIERATILATAQVDAREKTALKRSIAGSTDQVQRLLGVSRGFVTDIISDANGVAFHRFQVVAWSLVLTVIFISDVYRNLAMPDFSDTLLGLQSLSVLTYLGMKIPEAKPPKS